MPKSVRTENDGITTTTSTTFDLARISRSDARDLSAAIESAKVRASFELKIAGLEPYLRRQRGVGKTPRYGSRAWYAGAILETITAVRKLRDIGSRGSIDASLAAAMRVGYLAAEWTAKGWPDLALGMAHRKKQRARALEGVKTRRDNRARQDEALRARVAAQQAKHPTYSIRAIAGTLLPPSNATDDSAARDQALDSMRKRIERLLNTK